MGKRKRRARAMNRDPSAVEGTDHAQRRGETAAARGAQPASGRWRNHLKTLAVVALVGVALAVLIVGQIKTSSGSLTASARPAHGEALYDKYCVACHGAAGRGVPGWQYQARGAPPLDSSAHA